MLVPLVGGGAAKQFLYSVLFFAVAFLVALKPEKLTDRLGRILCPALIVLIVVLFAGCLIHPVAAHYGAPGGGYVAQPVAQGLLTGYQTMDTLAALNFGAVIALNIRARGVDDDKQVVRGTVRSGWIAGAVLLTIYAMLAHAGALSGAAFPGGETGADTLTSLAHALFGRPGQVLLAAIFLIACLNTCIGLISCVSEYFHGLFPRIPYVGFAAFFALASMVVSNIGLAGIIRLSTPVLNAIYLAAIVLIALSFVPRLETYRWVYPMTVGFTCVQSVVAALEQRLDRARPCGAGGRAVPVPPDAKAGKGKINGNPPDGKPSGGFFLRRSCTRKPCPKGAKNRHGQNAVPVLPGGGGMDPPVGRIYFFLTAPSLMMSQFLRR